MQKIIPLLCLLTMTMGSIKIEAQNLDKEIESIVTPLVASINLQTVKNVAIADFTSLDGTPSELGKYIAEEFTYHLVSAKKTFSVIDRSRVSALLKESGYGTTGRVDPNTIVKLGKMKGIDAVIAGTMTSTGNTIRLIVKVWNLETQGIVAVSRGDISKTPMISDLEGKEVRSSGGVDPILPTTKPPSAPAVAKFTKGHLTFELLSCTQVNQNIECKVRVISNGKDENLKVIPSYFNTVSSKIFTSSGYEYSLSESRLADKILTGEWGELEKSIVSTIPVNCLFIFSKVTETVKLVPKCIISCYTPSLGNFLAEFRNISVK